MINNILFYILSNKTENTILKELLYSFINKIEIKIFKIKINLINKYV
jgi:hypothetical protein